MEYSIGQVARYAGVSVRTLRHYHQVGLLVPGGRSSAGYRRYRDSDLERLQRVLFYRELGFPLDEIVTILDDPGIDPYEHLRRQRELLRHRIDRLGAMVAAVELAMEATRMGISLTPEERFEVFGPDDPAQYADEVRERWGDTVAYRQSRQRTAGYTKQDWEQVKREQADIDRRFVEALADGVRPGDPVAMEIAEAHRSVIQQRFYDLSYPMHRGLADLFLADERFRQRYEELAPGLAQFVHDAIHANADRAE